MRERAEKNDYGENNSLLRKMRSLGFSYREGVFIRGKKSAKAAVIVQTELMQKEQIGEFLQLLCSALSKKTLIVALDARSARYEINAKYVFFVRYGMTSVVSGQIPGVMTFSCKGDSALENARCELEQFGFSILNDGKIEYSFYDVDEAENVALKALRELLKWDGEIHLERYFLPYLPSKSIVSYFVGKNFPEKTDQIPINGNIALGNSNVGTIYIDSVESAKTVAQFLEAVNG